MAAPVMQSDLKQILPLVTRGKVRDLYEVDQKTLLFVATDRISAFDVTMENVYKIASLISFTSFLFSLSSVHLLTLNPPVNTAGPR